MQVYAAVRDAESGSDVAAGGLSVIKSLYEKQARLRRCHRSAGDFDRAFCEQRLSQRDSIAQPSLAGFHPPI